MKISIIGTGYVGLPTGVCLAELGHDVVCIDNDQEKIDSLKKGKITLFEKGLKKLLENNRKKKKISFTTSYENVEDADIIIIAVGTPSHPITKEADMKYIYNASKELSNFLKGYTVICTKSTVPIGTNDDIETIISNNNPKSNFDVVSLPEFLREGHAVHDFFNPDRIIVGTNHNRPKPYIKQLYKGLNHQTKLLFVSRRSAEAIKYASNAFLAMKIQYINEMTDFCEKVNADIHEVAKGMGLDKRIGNHFLNPGPGYGGSCFPKDTYALTNMANKLKIDLSLINTTIKSNNKRKIKMASKIINSLKDIKKDEKNIKIALLGLTFKGGTDDCRDSPAIEIVKILLEKNYNISIYDPEGMNNAKLIFDKLDKNEKLYYAKNPYDCVQKADALGILTDWEEFKNLDLKKLKKCMTHLKIVDLRHVIDKNKATSLGFSCRGV